MQLTSPGQQQQLPPRPAPALVATGPALVSNAADLQAALSDRKGPTAIDLGGRDIHLHGQMLLLDRPGVTLSNGRLVLHSGATVQVSARSTTFRHVDVVTSSAAAAAPAAAERLPGGLAAGRPMRHVAMHAPAAAPMSALAASGHDDDDDDHAGPLIAVGSGALLLDGCNLSAACGQRDLVHCFAELHLRYCHLSGGRNACMVPDEASALAECCTLNGYRGVGILASAGTARLVGCRVAGGGSGAATKGIAANCGARLSCVGCSIEGHGRADVCCSDDSSVELTGCVLGRAGADAAAIGSSGRAVLRDCDLANEVHVGGGQMELHGCSLELEASKVCAGNALAAALVRVVACRSARPLMFNTSGGAAISINDSPDLWVNQGAFCQ